MRPPDCRPSSDGAYSATYSYLANLPLVSQITYQHTTNVMTTSKQYDSAAQFPLIVVASTLGTNTISTTAALFLATSPEPFAYDTDGNLTRDGRWNYTWDGENRLVNMPTRSDVTAAPVRRLEFEYDWQGRRIGKKVYDARTDGTLRLNLRFLYDAWNLMGELDGSNNRVRTYAWGSDLSGGMQGTGGVGGLLNRLKWEPSEDAIKRAEETLKKYGD